MNTYDIIDRLPFELAAVLVSDPFFVDIPIVMAEAGNIRLEMERKQAVISEKCGKRGAAVVIPQLVADDPYLNLQFGPMKFFPQAQVIENVELNNDDNGTKKSHRKIARRIRDSWKNAGLVGLVQNFAPAKPCIEPVDMKDVSDNIKGSAVNFECLEISKEDFVLIQMPQFAGEGTSQLSITCATPGAQIWFTLDDSFPYPGDENAFPGSTAQLYMDPIPITGPVIVRARAYLDGLTNIASWTNRATITPA